MDERDNAVPTPKLASGENKERHSGRRHAADRCAGSSGTMLRCYGPNSCLSLSLTLSTGSCRAWACSPRATKCAAGGAIVIAIVMCTVIVIAEAPAPAGDAGTMLRCYGPTKAFP